MMKRIRKQSNKHWELHPLIAMLLERVNVWLRMLATFLQRKVGRYSIKKQRLSLIFFSAVCIGASVLVAIYSIKNKEAIFFAVAPIRVMPLEQEEKEKPALSSSALLHVHHFPIYLDSLRQTVRGKHLVDSFFKARPHLLDTINYLENRYPEK